MNIINSIQEKINNIKKDNEEYNLLLNNSQILTNLNPIPDNNNEIISYKIEEIIKNSPDINKEKAIIINKLIPIEETYLTSIYAKEIKTNKEYYIIPTNKYIWIVTTNEYLIIKYPNKEICYIVKNILMGKIINLNNVILEITGNDNFINNFINIINNSEYRNNIIKEKTNYLCGIIPKYQLIDENRNGISLDNKNNIVFHTKNDNYKCKIEEIENYELLEDNSIIFSKKLNSSSRITSSKTSCYNIGLRITTNNKILTIPLLEPTTFKSSYTKLDKEYQNKIKFANEIIEKIKIPFE